MAIYIIANRAGVKPEKERDFVETLSLKFGVEKAIVYTLAILQSLPW